MGILQKQRIWEKQSEIRETPKDEVPTSSEPSIRKDMWKISMYV